MTNTVRLRERQLIQEINKLRAQIDEPLQTVEALRSGQVDALVVCDELGEDIYTLTRSARSAELEETIRAIGDGEIDALVVSDGSVERVYALKAVQEALRESEDRLQLALDAADLIAWTLNISDGTFECMGSTGRSATWSAMPEKEHLSDALARVHSEDRANVEQRLHAAIHANVVFQSEHRLVLP